MALTMQTQARFPNYAVCLWALPADLQPAAERIETNAKDFLLARNADGESHLVLCFDLEPGAQVRVRLLPP
jgi:hypothetical protein